VSPGASRSFGAYAVEPPPPPAPGRLIAVGDSWFRHFPPFDAIVALERKHGYAVHSLAKPSTPLQALVPKPGQAGQLDELRELLGRMSAAQRHELRAILLSGGGNDVVDQPDVPPDAQSWLRQLLVEPPALAPPYIRTDTFEQLIRGTLQAALASVLGTITALCEEQLGRRVPILIHGYDHPVPDGRGADKAPWLKPAMDAAGYARLSVATDIMRELIDGLNDMQRGLLRSRPREFAHVRHVDLRGTLGNRLDGDTYRAMWQNELHPTIPDGFIAIADRLHAALGTPDAPPAPPPSAARYRKAAR
jgi:hypothetical protein